MIQVWTVPIVLMSFCPGVALSKLDRADKCGLSSGRTKTSSCWMIGETSDFLGVLGRFIQRPRVTGGVVHDARIVAICAAHNADELLTRDRDFSLFPELHLRNPVVEA